MSCIAEVEFEVLEAQTDLLDLVFDLLHPVLAAKLGGRPQRLAILVQKALTCHLIQVQSLPEVNEALIWLNAFARVLLQPLAHLLHNKLHLLNLVPYDHVHLLLRLLML